MRVRAAMRSDGFSLIELIVVVMLIGVIVTLIVPQIRGTYEDALLRSTGRKLADATSLAHSQAVTLNAAHRLRIDLAANRYLVEKAVRDPARGPGFVPVPNVPGSEGALDARIAIEIRHRDDQPPTRNSAPAPVFMSHEASEPGRSILFYPDGTADPAEIRLRDREGFGLFLRISHVTGRVKIGPIEREYR